MGLGRKILGDADMVKEYKAAKARLAANTDTTETTEYLDLNDKVAATGKTVPWWRR